jgi:hypothetical protein
VTDGITYRALRDPASVQQKAGRVGRELGSDSVVVHLVTETARDHYYFRNPLIALDPTYLQPVPLHENNRIVARQHLFMAILDFLALQGANPDGQRVPGAGDRLLLINDQRNSPRPQIATFYGWDEKVNGAWEYLFGNHPRQSRNLDISPWLSDVELVLRPGPWHQQLSVGRTTPGVTLSDCLFEFRRLGWLVEVAVLSYGSSPSGLMKNRDAYAAEARFLSALIAVGIRVYLVPDLHAKGIVTPLGVITGSTNLTRSGLYAQSQNANYFPHGHPDYSGNRSQLLRCFRGKSEPATSV